MDYSDNDDENSQESLIDLNESKKPINIEFDIKKPGTHAKAGEWRKWKMMQRQIKQARTEKRLLKKRKIDAENEQNIELKEIIENEQVVAKKEKKPNYTISIAIPGSMISKVQSKELKTYVCGQIARAACLYCVNEIIVYNDNSIENKTLYEDDNQLMIKILEYLECPQYLRKTFFPSQKLLEFVGLLHPLDALHHLRKDDEWLYREGVTTDIQCKHESATWVDIGLMHKILIDKKIQPGIRVTVKKEILKNNKIKGVVVSPYTPRIDNGIYWGYQVRFAKVLSKVLRECPFEGGYDLKISVDNNNCLNFDDLKEFSNFNHVLIVFGGANGIETAIESDEKLKANKIDQLFDYQINKQLNIGSRSVRSEEAILITLTNLKPYLDKICEINNKTDNE